jgi:hypothetical protein
MTNEITNATKSFDEITATRDEMERYPILDPKSPQRSVLTSMAEPFNHTQCVRIKAGTGGSTVWSYEDFDGQQTCDLVTGIVVGTCLRWYLWPHAQPGSGSSPLMISYDGVNAWQTGDDFGELDEALIEKSRNDDGSFDMSTLHYNKRNTAANGGAGSRMARKRFVYVLRPQTVMPVCVQVSAGSAVPVDRFFQQCPTPCYQTEINLGLKSKQGNFGSFSQVVISRNADRLLGAAASEFMRLNYFEPFQSSFLIESLVLSDS